MFNENRFLGTFRGHNTRTSMVKEIFLLTLITIITTDLKLIK